MINIFTSDFLIMLDFLEHKMESKNAIEYSAWKIRLKIQVRWNIRIIKWSRKNRPTVTDSRKKRKFEPVYCVSGHETVVWSFSTNQQVADASCIKSAPKKWKIARYWNSLFHTITEVVVSHTLELMVCDTVYEKGIVMAQ